MTARLEILSDKCVGCGACLSSCPIDALSLEGGKAVVSTSCSLCGMCVNSCPFDAIVLHHVIGGASGLESYSGIMVVAELRDGRPDRSTLELLGEARRLAGKEKRVTALLICADSSDTPGVLVQYGADRVLTGAHPALAHYLTEPYAAVLLQAVRTDKPEIVLAAATTQGRDLMPRVAKLLDTGLTADCTELGIDSETGLLMQTRPAFGGNIMATIVCDRTRPQMSTVRPGVMKKLEPDTSRKGIMETLNVNDSMVKSRTVLEEFVPTGGTEVDLTEAEVIVSGGRGMKGPENYDMLHELAGLLGGSVGASRAAVDSGWIPYPRQVGQTGKTVQPKRYIAVGISGAVQHRVGMQSSDEIFAVNRDPDAPIFTFATHGFVGDLFEVIPALISEIRRRRS
ncbi:MAG: electron transfer flavoprotein subunit alpha [Candidatus Fermentibacteraceae bacterium]